MGSRRIKLTKTPLHYIGDIATFKKSASVNYIHTIVESKFESDIQPTSLFDEYFVLLKFHQIKP